MKVLIASSIDSGVLEKLRRQHDVVCAFNAPEEKLRSLIADRDVLIFRSGVNISSGVMACAPNLKLLIRAGSGLDNLDLDYARSRSMKLVRIHKPGGRAVAELAFTLMLALSRQILEADRLLRAGHWAKHELNGCLLFGKVLGIIGAGNIGEQLGQLGVAWGMSVIAYDITTSSERTNELAKKGIVLSELQDVLKQADYLSIHVPLNDSTRNLIGAEEFAQLKPGAFLTHLARGGVVDEAALLQALKKPGGLGGAALDVHEHEGEGKISPLAGRPNVILTPHIGSNTIDTQQEIGRRILEAIAAFEAENKGTAHE